MREEWRPVVGYEELYEVSNMGNVKSLNYKRTGKERILKPYDNGNGYLQVNLCKDGKCKHYCVHQLVATAFIQFVPQEGVAYDVDHRNTDRTDNRAINLCWVSRSQNMNNPITNSKLSKPVIGIDWITGLIVEFTSIMEAERKLGISHSHICSCLKGRYKTAGGFYWMYANNDDDE